MSFATIQPETLKLVFLNVLEIDKINERGYLDPASLRNFASCMFVNTKCKDAVLTILNENATCLDQWAKAEFGRFNGGMKGNLKLLQGTNLDESQPGSAYKSLVKNFFGIKFDTSILGKRAHSAE